MIKTAGNFNDFILRKILSKVICFSVASVVIFNCVFASFIFEISSDELSKISSIQKDVFSAVFLISSAIEKINFSLTSKIAVASSNKQDSSEKENKIPSAAGDIIITGTQTQNEHLTPYNHMTGANVTLYDRIIRTLIFLRNGLFAQTQTVYFMTMLIFFCCARKIFDNNYKNLSTNI